ncbi:MAG: transporter substrate-binding domain-containing protein [Desulfobacula sp.]|nr:transporter substrate-binding domain-containing protein [Desulfobacula sp.]
MAENIIIVYAEKGYMPYYSSNAMQGMYIEFLKKFECSHPQFTIILKPMSRKRMDVMMKLGKADVFALNSPEFADTKEYLFSDPIWRESSVLFTRKSDFLPIKSFDDLMGKRIGIIFGNSYPALEYLFGSGKVKTHPVATSIQLFDLLRFKKIDAFVGDKNVTLYRLKRKGFKGEFRYLTKPLFEFSLTIQIQKSKQQFQASINQFIKESKNNGFLQQSRINSINFSDR